MSNHSTNPTNGQHKATSDVLEPTLAVLLDKIAEDHGIDGSDATRLQDILSALVNAPGLIAWATRALPQIKHSEGCERYLLSHGLCCPHCDSRDIEATRTDLDTTEGYASCTCHDCGAEWQDKWVLVGFTGLTVPQGNTCPNCERDFYDLPEGHLCDQCSHEMDADARIALEGNSYMLEMMNAMSGDHCAHVLAWYQVNGLALT